VPSQQSPQSRQSEVVEVVGLVTWRSLVQYHRTVDESGPTGRRRLASSLRATGEPGLFE
jgi:hypothetical protein